MVHEDSFGTKRIEQLVLRTVLHCKNTYGRTFKIHFCVM